MLEEGIGDAATEQEPAPEGATLRVLLKLRKMTQKTLSERSGINKSTISRYVRGERPISRSDWGRLRKALQITLPTWAVAEDLLFRLDWDRRRFGRISRGPGEYENIESAAEEIREGPPKEAWADDPDAAHDVVDGVVRIVERSLHQITDLLIEARR